MRSKLLDTNVWYQSENRLLCMVLTEHRWLVLYAPVNYCMVLTCKYCGREIMAGGTDTDKLSGTYKDLWRTYQNDESRAIAELSYDELEERILKWESIEFEARAKRQRDIAEKRTRDLVAQKQGRDSLIGNPKYSPSDSPSKAPVPFKVKTDPKPRQSMETKLKGSLADLGVDLGDLLKDVKAKKVKEMLDGMENK